MSGQAWYRHYATKFLDGVVGMPPDQIGAYIVVLDLIYARGGAIPNDTRWLSGHMGCSTRAAGALVLRLIQRGKLSLNEEKISALIVADWQQDGRLPVPLWLRRAIMERDAYCCTYCGAKDGPFEIDHIFPVALGGGNEPENLTTACISCNRSKGAKTVGEWAR